MTFNFYYIKSSSSDHTKADFAYGFDFLFCLFEGAVSTGLNPSGAQIFSFLDGLVGLLVFFLRRAILDFGFEGPADVEGPGSVRVLSASSAEEDEMIMALLDDLVAADKTLAEAALDRGEVLEPIIS